MNKERLRQRLVNKVHLHDYDCSRLPKKALWNLSRLHRLQSELALVSDSSFPNNETLNIIMFC